MEYIVVMKFLSWFFALLVLFGYGTILQCERELCREYPVTDELTRLAMQKIIDDYNGRNWAGRVAIVIYWGWQMITIPLDITIKIIKFFLKRGRKNG